VAVDDAGDVRAAELPVLARHPDLARRPVRVRPPRAAAVPVPPPAPRRVRLLGAAACGRALNPGDVRAVRERGVRVAARRLPGQLARRGFGKSRIIPPFGRSRRGPQVRTRCTPVRSGRPVRCERLPGSVCWPSRSPPRSARSPPRRAPRPPRRPNLPRPSPPTPAARAPPPPPGGPAAPPPGVAGTPPGVRPPSRGGAPPRGDFFTSPTRSQPPAGDEAAVYKDAMDTLVNPPLINQSLPR